MQNRESNALFSSEHVIQNKEFTSRVSVCEFLLAVLIMCAMWTTGISKARTLAPSVSLLIGQLMSGNLLYLKSLLNAIVYARRLTKYRQAFYKSFRRKKNGKYSKERTRDGHATRRKYEVAELSSFTSTAVSKRSKNTELKIPIQTGLFLLPATRWWRAGVKGGFGRLINMPVKKNRCKLFPHYKKKR